MRKQDKIIINSKCREDWERLIYNWIHNDVDRKMFIRWALDGRTNSEISEEFGILDKRCQERISAAKEQLFSHVEIVLK
jgi:hypothetical protein